MAERNDYFLYTGSQTREIRFPLGGLGTGCISIAGNGRLIDWEIFNRPNKGSVNGFSHFAIKAERDGQVIDARVLHSDLESGFTGEVHAPRFQTYGFGPRREYMTGLPHFRTVDFRGEYPFAELSFIDATFPGSVTLTAFNPFIPLKDKESGLPAAFFEFKVINNTPTALDYSLAGVLGNPLPEANIHEFARDGSVRALHLMSNALAASDVRYGDLTLATDAEDVSYQQFWFRGTWFDALEVYWRDLTTPGKFKNRIYPVDRSGQQNQGLLATHFHLEPGEARNIRFVIAWNFPNCKNYWDPEADAKAARAGVLPTWKNFYATQWEHSLDSATYGLQRWDSLYAETRLFHDALFASTLPAPILDAVSANLAVLKSPTVLRLEDGTFYGWEGTHVSEGCCEGSCTHVWNYAQALPFLFPALERSMRTADFKYNQRPDGGMVFRIQLPLGIAQWDFRPCADGQFGGVLKTYRDWKISGDTDWLRGLWPAVKRSIAFAWSPENEDRWDPEMTGVLWGRQHHTLDMELFGPNSWLTGFYLGALKAGAEMAEYLGDAKAAADYRRLFEQGKAWADKNLFNGAYYHQLIDLKDRAIIEQFADGTNTLTGSALDAYWNAEHGEIKYQIGQGSGVDQVLAQWHANLYGLGDLFDPVQTRQALQSEYALNFKRDMRERYNPCRVYCLDDEAGLIICVWPTEVTKPVIPLPYSQETQNGYEYASASQMAQVGLVDEALEIVAAIRGRYDGEMRNPWNEFECGNHYARSMAAFSLLHALSGFQFDMVNGHIGFKPVVATEQVFRCFWSLDSAWGEFETAPGTATLLVHQGSLTLRTLGLPLGDDAQVHSVLMTGAGPRYRQDGSQIEFLEDIQIHADEALSVKWLTGVNSFISEI